MAFVGYVASHERVAADPTLSSADNRMQRGYAAALAEQFADLTIFSTVPAYPGQGPSPLDEDDDGLRVRHLGAASGWSRAIRKPLALARELDSWARAHRGRPTLLLHYNTFLLYVLVAVWLRRRHGTRIVPVAITMPYRSPDVRASSASRVQDWLSARLLRGVDGIVAITPFLVSELAPGRPGLVIRGAVFDESLVDDGLGEEPAADPVELVGQPAGPASIVYAGNLTPRYHLAEAVAMMAHLPAAEFVLHVYGRGVLEPMVREAADSAPNITFHGAVDESAVPPLLRDADVLLALLTPDDEMARLTFPSKLFESLASGTPTLTTDLPTLDDAMRAQLVVVTDLAPACLAATVTDVCGRTSAERLAAAAGAQQFLREQGTWSAVGRRLRTFLETLEATAR
ncbi:glycosyltransferase [Nocardioides sp. GCM10028917]|uniref:glycosyltransferase n=1 Tax=Nocardioides sp. GCM10028917 TaxID=3273408 RepID=UPI00360D6794